MSESKPWPKHHSFFSSTSDPDQPEIVRGRVFEPDDLHYRSQEEINERVDELKEVRANFDPETQFCGLRRIGSKYSVVEPFAFFDGPIYEQRKIYRALLWGGGFVVGVVINIVAQHYRHGNQTRGVVRGLLMGPIIGWIGNLAANYQTERSIRRQNTYFHYALMHEKDFPLVERKKFGEILNDWPATRSRNVFGHPFTWSGSM